VKTSEEATFDFGFHPVRSVLVRHGLRTGSEGREGRREAQGRGEGGKEGKEGKEAGEEGEEGRREEGRGRRWRSREEVIYPLGKETPLHPSGRGFLFFKPLTGDPWRREYLHLTNYSP